MHCILYLCRNAEDAVCLPQLLYSRTDTFTDETFIRAQCPVVSVSSPLYSSLLGTNFIFTTWATNLILLKSQIQHCCVCQQSSSVSLQCSFSSKLKEIQVTFSFKCNLHFYRGRDSYHACITFCFPTDTDGRCRGNFPTVRE